MKEGWISLWRGTEKRRSSLTGGLFNGLTPSSVLIQSKSEDEPYNTFRLPYFGTRSEIFQDCDSGQR
jgi:hypothetical protein